MLAIGVLSFSLANVALGTRLVQENGSIQQFRLLQSYDVIGAMVWPFIDPETPLEQD